LVSVLPVRDIKLLRRTNYLRARHPAARANSALSGRKLCLELLRPHALQAEIIQGISP